MNPVLDRFRLDGRTVVVTGASSGLGAGFAVALAHAGADVVLGARRADRLGVTARAVEAVGGRALAVWPTCELLQIETRALEQQCRAVPAQERLRRRALVGPTRLLRLRSDATTNVHAAADRAFWDGRRGVDRQG